MGKLKLTSRLLLGTANYPSPQILLQAIEAANTEIITVSLRRTSFNKQQNNFKEILKKTHCHILPNTAGCMNSQEAITTAEMARELFNTNLIKLEVIGDEATLHPDPFELVKAAEYLIQSGFEVLPYCSDDIVLCRRLVDVGCKILMPLAAPIGTGRGLINIERLIHIRQSFPNITLIVDAGIGKPSHATAAMEIGYDGVLLNTAVANALDPVKMAEAFSLAIVAGRKGYEAGLIPEQQFARASSPTLGQPFTENILV